MATHPFKDSGDPEMNEIIRKFETMIQENDSIFFDIEQLLDLIDHYSSTQESEMMEKAINHALALYPDEIDVEIRLAQLWASGNNFQKALNLLTHLGERDPSHADISFLKGAILSEEGFFEQAIAPLKQAVLLDPKFDTAYALLASAYEALEQPQKALEFFKEAVSLAPDNADYLYDLCLCFEHLGAHKEAIAFLDIFLDKHPLSIPAWFNKGMAHYHIKQTDEAIKAFDYCLAIDASYMSAYIFKSKCYSDNENYELAIEILQYGLVQCEEKVPFYICIGSCYEFLRNWNAALENYKQAVNISPPFADTWSGMARVYLELNMIPAAIAAAKQAISIEPQSLSTLLNAGNIMLQARELKQAKDYFLQILDLDKANLPAYQLLAETYFLEDDADKALKTLLDSLEYIEDEDPKILIQLCCYMFRSGELDELYDILSDVLDIFPEAGQLFFEVCPESKDNPKILSIIEQHKQK